MHSCRQRCNASRDLGPDAHRQTEAAADAAKFDFRTLGEAGRKIGCINRNVWFRRQLRNSWR
jgi:hypothetical protein